MELTQVLRKDTAFVFDVNPRTVLRWTKSGMPKNSDGTYDLRACIRWRMEQLEEDIVPSGMETEESQKWLAEFRKEKSKIAKMDRKEREGGLIPKDQVVRDATYVGALVKSKLNAIPNRFAALVAAEKDAFKCEQILRVEVNNVLQELAGAARTTGHENNRAIGE